MIINRRKRLKRRQLHRPHKQQFQPTIKRFKQIRPMVQHRKYPQQSYRWVMTPIACIGDEDLVLLAFSYINANEWIKYRLFLFISDDKKNWKEKHRSWKDERNNYGIMQLVCVAIIGHHCRNNAVSSRASTKTLMLKFHRISSELFDIYTICGCSTQWCWSAMPSAAFYWYSMAAESVLNISCWVSSMAQYSHQRRSYVGKCLCHSGKQFEGSLASW